ncbi:MAG: hypothetical protein RBT69_04880 [Spirochaetia bacterium]|jgi:TolB-like protein|nr:hypothetical protein [Spirochaetia bacterium]
MKKRNIIIICLLHLVFLVNALSAQQETQNPEVLPVIAVSEIKNMTALSSIDRTSGLIEETLIRNLDLTGKFTTVICNKEKQFNDKNVISDYCIENNFSYLITGNVKKSGRDVTIELNVFSAFSNDAQLTVKESAETPAKLRSSMDNVFREVFKFFTNKNVSFSSLSFVNRGEETGDYFLFIDSVNIGRNIEYIDYILSGSRNILILQNRMGSEKILADTAVFLKPEERVNIEFEIPGLTEREKKLISRYEKPISLYADDKFKSRRVADAFDSLFSLLEDPSFCASAVKKKDDITAEYEIWKKKMDKWGLERGLTSADLPYSAGLKTMVLSSSYNVSGWDFPGSKPQGQSSSSMGGGFFCSADIFKYSGIQGEFNFYNQKIPASFDSGYPLADSSIMETSAWFLEFPLIAYFRIPSYLLKFYAGAALKYRTTVMSLDITNGATGASSGGEYDEELLRMANSSWIAGGSFEFPLNSSLFFLDFRYSRDFYSWFESSAPEADFIASYLACSIGYTIKGGK